MNEVTKNKQHCSKYLAKQLKTIFNLLCLLTYSIRRSGYACWKYAVAPPYQSKHGIVNPLECEVLFSLEDYTIIYARMRYGDDRWLQIEDISKDQFEV